MIVKEGECTFLNREIVQFCWKYAVAYEEDGMLHALFLSNENSTHSLIRYAQIDAKGFSGSWCSEDGWRCQVLLELLKGILTFVVPFQGGALFEELE